MKITNKSVDKVWILTSNEHHDGPVKVVGVYATKESAQKEYDRRCDDMRKRWLSLNMKEYKVAE